jgi:uncharacterized membrane protein YgcG
VAVPRLQARVTDLTATLAASDTANLEDTLKELETRSGAQVAVLLVPTTQPETIEQYSIRVVEAWKLGRKDKDNGVLLLVAKNDRKVRIEVGYGLEGAIPDVTAFRIINEDITPRFKQGDFAGGIAAGVARIAALIEGGDKAASEADSPGPPPTIDDRTGTLTEEQQLALRNELLRFYDSGRTKPVFILVVPTTNGEALADFAQRTLDDWGSTHNLDVDRSLLLAVAQDTHQAAIATGAGLGAKLPKGWVEALLNDRIDPLLAQGKLAAALETGVQGIEALIDAAIANRDWSERLGDEVSDLPMWLIIVVLVVGTALRWVLGPFFGGLTMGGLVGTVAWFVSGTIEVALFAALFAFVFFLVGLANWIAMGLSGSSGGGGSSSSGGGFSGGGGSFGGGGASGSW